MSKKEVSNRLLFMEKKEINIFGSRLNLIFLKLKQKRRTLEKHLIFIEIMENLLNIYFVKKIIIVNKL